MKRLSYKKEYESFKWNFPKHYNLGYDIVDKHAENPLTKNKVALYWENEAGEQKKFTFWEMRTLSNKFGNAMRTLGIRRGDRVLLRLPNIPEFHVAFVGLMKIGAVAIPSSVMFRQKEIAYRINDSGAVAVIATDQYVKEVDDIYEECPTLKFMIVVGNPHKEHHIEYQHLMESSPRYLDIAETRSDDVAFIAYTSGTTGDPKGATHLHRFAMANDPISKYWQAYEQDDISAFTGALSWIYGTGNALTYPWRHGISTFLYEGAFDAEKWYSLLEKYEITNLASVPTIYRMLVAVEDAHKRYDLSHLKHCISAGEPLNPEVIVKWKERFGVTIHDGIGQTEVMVFLSNQRGMKVKPGSCGRPLPGHTTAVVDEHGKPLPPGKLGILALKKDDPGLLKDYWNKPKETRKVFKNEWYLTGDTLYTDKDGYFWFAGRHDDLIMTAGYRVSPFEVESVVNEHPAVLESAAVASPDTIRGVIVKSFIVLKNGQAPSEDLAEQIIDYAKKNMAPYKHPRAIEFMDALPKTQSGKIKRKLLRQQEDKKAAEIKEKETTEAVMDVVK